MNVLVIGSGGREHAIVWKVSQSPGLTKLYALPGNPGTAELAENVSGISVDDYAAIIVFCKDKQIELVIVGPEAPLAAGLVDSLSAEGIRCFGPSQAAAQIEASKSFAKDFMARHTIPTAKYETFSNYDEAVQYLESVDYPIVIKASGLAAGKGVILPDTLEEAKSTLEDILVKRVFGDAGTEVVIEERMTGQEVSLMAFTDGTSVVPMLPAQDHKRLLDGDEGPNTGGMGAYAPAPIFTAEMMDEAVEHVLKPAVIGMKREGNPFVGVLYAGLMLTLNGIRVLEFNCRFGDPETQVVLPLLETDLLEIAGACVDGRLNEMNIYWKKGAAVCVVLASKGYPDKVESGKVVSIEKLPDDMVCFHAGTKLENGNLITSGGRVFGLTAWGEDIEGAFKKVYSNINKASFGGMQYRRDIAHRALS
ncbi:MAG: phosphoribosylamine--glycine ligase [Chloroflexi bacterium]|nr:phosphoribosylamine--glycine ligase [Chloroflexota bacterium]MBI3168733.1 phosphoribosylamine--glycine ligase [Chloroflexota bacterium]